MRIAATTLSVTLTTLLFATHAAAQALVVQLSEPAFTVTIPGLPSIQLGPHPAAAQNPAARLLGTSPDGINVSALTPKAEGASAQQCASWLAGSTISRYTPDLASVQLIPAGSNAWVLVYPFKVAGVEQLKAHIFSGNGRGQCLEIHVSRIAANEQQRQAWFSGFRGITVKAGIDRGAQPAAPGDAAR
ncbi:MAG: hypothetical protein ABIK82_08010 [Pseudomonadota bacterium]